jgi:hypothetical protein
MISEYARRHPAEFQEWIAHEHAGAGIQDLTLDPLEFVVSERLAPDAPPSAWTKLLREMRIQLRDHIGLL